jgi:hypothetical protein
VSVVFLDLESGLDMTLLRTKERVTSYRRYRYFNFRTADGEFLTFFGDELLDDSRYRPHSEEAQQLKQELQKELSR